MNGHFSFENWILFSIIFVLVTKGHWTMYNEPCLIFTQQIQCEPVIRLIAEDIQLKLLAECFQSHFFNLVTKVFHELTHSTSQVWLGIYLANNKFSRFISTFVYSLFNELMISENFFVHAVFCVLTLMPFERNMCQDVTLS